MYIVCTCVIGFRRGALKVAQVEQLGPHVAPVLVLDEALAGDGQLAKKRRFVALHRLRNVANFQPAPAARRRRRGAVGQVFAARVVCPVRHLV